MKQRAVLGILLAFGLLMPAGSTAAQEQEELRLTVRRTFGYRGGDQIQGRFALGIEGPEDLVRVAFFIDGKVMAEDREAPFEHSFLTREYGLGIHRLSAIGHTAGGAELRSVGRTFEFVTAEAGWETAGRIVAPLAVAILGILVVGTVIPAVLGRKHPFRLGDYGAAGGAVCPRCQLPYPRRFWSPNLVGGKLERCPHCGKWAMARRATATMLQAAEARYLLESRPQVVDDQDPLSRLIDDSRFES
ncbi:MAG: hypothetical protein AABY97_02340 [Chloroflexota bacterium]